MSIIERKLREQKRRKQQILVAASRVFSKKGYSKTTMSDVANDAELSPGTIYLYFKNQKSIKPPIVASAWFHPMSAFPFLIFFNLKLAFYKIMYHIMRQDTIYVKVAEYCFSF